MQPIITAAQLRNVQLQGAVEHQITVNAVLSSEDEEWVTQTLQSNLKLAHSLAYYHNETFLLLQFDEDGLKKHVRYARQPQGMQVGPGHALTSAMREVLTTLYTAGYSVSQEYRNGELPGTLWSPRGPQCLMLHWD